MPEFDLQKLVCTYNFKSLLTWHFLSRLSPVSLKTVIGVDMILLVSLISDQRYVFSRIPRSFASFIGLNLPPPFHSSLEKQVWRSHRGGC